MSARNFSQAANAMQIINAIAGDPTPRIESFIHYTTQETLYRWAGAVPVPMVWKRRDGKELSHTEMKGIIKFGAMGKVHQTRSFQSYEDAIAYGQSYGIEAS